MPGAWEIAEEEEKQAVLVRPGPPDERMGPQNSRINDHVHSFGTEGCSVSARHSYSRITVSNNGQLVNSDACLLHTAVSDAAILTC